MTDQRNKRSGTFAGVMLIYALLVIALILAAMRPFWDYLAAYEESGSGKAMDRYVESFDEAHIRSVSESFLEGLDLGLQSREQAFESVKKCMSGSLRYSLRSSSSDLLHETYAIRSGQRLLGTVTIGKEKDPPFGFSPWVVEEENFDFSWLLGEDVITVPEGWTVLCNGTVLDASYRTGEKLPYELLADFYRDSRFSLPYMVTYRVDRVVGDAPFSLVNARGESVEAQAALTEFEMLANCSDAESAEMAALLDEFLPRYITCLSNANHNARGNYEALKPYILADSDIDRRVYDNMAGQQWAHSKGDTVEERSDHLYLNMGNGYYLADITYTLDSVNERAHIKTVNNARILMSMTEQGLRVIEFYTY